MKRLLIQFAATALLVFPATAAALCALSLDPVTGAYLVGDYTALKLVGVGDCSLGGAYQLSADIDAIASNTENDDGAGTYMGFLPIGTYTGFYGPAAEIFIGTFNGGNHVIANLTIRRDFSVGLFAQIGYGAVIKDLQLKSIHYEATGEYAGGLTGYNLSAGISNITVDGTITSGANTTSGGVVGFNSSYGVISASKSSMTMTGSDTLGYVGGIIGINQGSLSKCVNSGTVHGSGKHSYIGGLAGINNGNVTISNNSGLVIGSDSSNIGGLVGLNGSNGKIQLSYNTGAVSGALDSWVGGLVGQALSTGSMKKAYNTGTVTGAHSSYVGGLIAINHGTLMNSYNTGAVSDPGTSNVAGLVGINSGAIDTCYNSGSVTSTAAGSVAMGLVADASTGTLQASFWDTEASGVGTDAMASSVGLTTAQMMQSASFPTWNFSSTWIMYDTQTRPLLRDLFAVIAVTGKTIAKQYDGTAFSFSTNADSVVYDYAGCDPAGIQGAMSLTGTALGALHVGSYTYIPSGLSYVNASPSQFGCIIQYAPGSLTIDPRKLDITGIVATPREYDGTSNVAFTGTVANTVGNEDVKLLQGHFGTTKVGNGRPVYATDADLSGTDAANYTIPSALNIKSNITYKLLTVSDAVAQSKPYDGTLSATITDASLAGKVAGEVVDLIRGTFASKQVGTGLTVTATSANLSGTDAVNYALANSLTFTANITPAKLTITAANYTTTVSGNIEYNYIFNGLVARETITVLPGLDLLSNEGDVPGEYPLTPCCATNLNYDITYVPGILTLTEELAIARTFGTSNAWITPVQNGLWISGIRGTVEVMTLRGALAATIQAQSDGIYPLNLSSGVYALRSSQFRGNITIR